MSEGNNTPQHSVRADSVLWRAYKEHRKSLDSNASEGLRNHMIGELRSVGKLPTGVWEDTEIGVPA